MACWRKVPVFPKSTVRQRMSTSPVSFSVTLYSLKYKSCHNYRIKHEVLLEIKGRVALTVNKFYKKLLSRSKHSRDTLSSFLSFHSSPSLRWSFGATRQASPSGVNPEDYTEAKIALLLIDRVSQVSSLLLPCQPPSRVLSSFTCPCHPSQVSQGS